jgi:hypothetical protein
MKSPDITDITTRHGPEAARAFMDSARPFKARGNSNWLSACILNDKKKPMANLANVLIALRAEMPDSFAFDEMSCTVMLMEPVERNAGFKPRPLGDIDVGAVQERLQHLGLPHIGKEVMHQAVDICAHEHRFHPVKNYLAGLAWDGTQLPLWRQRRLPYLRLCSGGGGKTNRSIVRRSGMRRRGHE